jgi:GNAT superfamily N-acetyltransferase
MRVARPEPGRYWIVTDGDGPCGVLFQSPITYFATATPMASEAAVALVDAIVAAEITLPGLTGEAATAAAFAGHWAERAQCPVRPAAGQRLYEVREVTMPSGVDGAARVGGEADVDVLARWMHAFQVEIGEAHSSDAAEVVRRRAGEFWVWDVNGESVSMAAVSAPQAGVVRIGPVYTPPEQRGHGYAAALVGSMSRDARDAGLRCILYTDLANPTSNAVYQRLGYRAVCELLRYEFSAPAA